ncbi:MAG: hypothetical protein AABZ57_00720 [Candidatus Margulisiibacteriota bacterium]
MDENAVSSDKKLKDSIKKFALAYKALTPRAKTAFQNQLNSQLNEMDARTKKLYESLIEAAKKGMDIEKTIEEMEEVDRKSRGGL